MYLSISALSVNMHVVQISEVKEKVEAVDASMRASSLILIHSGKILADDMTLDTAGVKEGNFLVAMVSAKKATTASKAKEEKKAETPAPAAPATAAPTSTSTEPAAAATPAGASVDPAATPSAPAKPEGGAEEGTAAGTGDEAATPSAVDAASNLVSGSKAEETVRL